MGARAAEPLEAIRSQLDAYPVVRAEFTQTRRVAALAKPLTSQGRLLLVRGEGVVWEVEQPYRQTYVLKRDVMLEIAPDGSRARRVDAGAALRINQAVRALIGGDTGTLHGLFETEAALERGQWRLVLVPKQQQVAQYIRKVELRGGQYMEAVDIDATNGDQTRFTFHGHRKGDLSADERRLFNIDQ